MQTALHLYCMNDELLNLEITLCASTANALKSQKHYLNLVLCLCSAEQPEVPTFQRTTRREKIANAHESVGPKLQQTGFIPCYWACLCYRLQLHSFHFDTETPICPWYKCPKSIYGRNLSGWTGLGETSSFLKIHITHP